MRKIFVFLGWLLLVQPIFTAIAVPPAPVSEEERLKSAIRIHPDHWLGYLRLSVHYQRLQQWDKALESLLDAQKKNPNSIQIAQALGYVYRNLGNLSQALAFYQKAIEQFPKEATFYVERGKLFWEHREIADAAKDLKKAIEQDPELFEAHFLLGVLYAAQQQPNQALASLIQASKINSEHPELWYQISMLWERVGNRLEAMRAIETAVALEPGQQNYLQYYILLLEKTEDIPGLERALQAFVTLFPNDPWGHAHYGSLAIQKQQYDFAEEELQQALKLNPEYSWAAFRLGTLYSQQQDWARATVAFREGLKYDPRNLSARQNLGAAYNAQGDIPSAILTYEDALTQGYHSPFIFVQLAQLYWENLQLDKVEPILKDGLIQFTNDGDLMLQLAQFYEFQQRPDEARQIYLELLKANEDTGLLAQLGQLEQAAGNFEKSREYFRHALDLDPLFHAARLQLIALLVDLDQTAEAQTELKLVIQNHPDNDWGYSQLALLSFKQKDYESALRWVEEGLDHIPQSLPLQEILTLVQQKLERWKESIESIHRALESKPHHPSFLTYQGVSYLHLGEQDKAKESFLKALMGSDIGIIPLFHYLLVSDLETQKRWFGPSLNEIRPLLLSILQSDFFEEVVLQQKITDPSIQTTLLSLQQLLQGHPEEALTTIEKINDPSSQPWILFYNGYLYNISREDGKALPFYLSLTLQLPGDPWVEIGLGGVYEDQGEHLKSIGYFSRFTDKYPEAAWALFSLALLQGEAKLEKEAIATYQRVITLDPDYSAALNNLAWLYLTSKNQELRNPIKALELSQKAISMEASIEHIDTLAEAYFQTNQAETAIAIVRRAILTTEFNSKDFLYLMKQYQRFIGGNTHSAPPTP